MYIVHNIRMYDDIDNIQMKHSMNGRGASTDANLLFIHLSKRCLYNQSINEHKTVRESRKQVME